MKNNTGKTENNSLLQQFAVKSNRIKITYNDRAVIYNRCSTDKQDSLEWQDKVCANYSKHLNFVLDRCFGEKESATTDDREQFQEMLAYCEKENISNIIIYSYDRFSRTGDLELLKELREKGIRVHAATQSVDDQTASGRFSQKMYLMFAEMENEQRREKIIEGQKNKLRKGEWIGKPTIGYIKEYVTGKKEHDLDKKQCFIGEEGKLIKQAFFWKDQEKLTYEKIIERLKTMGVHVTPPQLTRIFRNPFYCGFITHSLLDDGEIIRGKHEPLISEEVFLRVNGVISGNRQGWKVRKENDAAPLKKSVACGLCDRPFTAYMKKGKYTYYKCPNPTCCVNISNNKLHKLFADELSKFTITPQLLPLIESQLEATYRLLHSSEVERVKPMKDELARLKNELETMEFNLATSKISFDLFQKYSAGHLQKIQVIEEELKTLAHGNSNLEVYLNKTLKYASNLLEMWQLMDCGGKLRLQKLVYPDGLRYMPENRALRTNSVNPIFSFIASFSKNLGVETSSEQCHENEKLRQLYLRFSSSNFLLENLQEIAKVFEEIEKQYSLRPEAFFPQTAISMTGATPIERCFYTSETTSISDTSPQHPKLYSGVTNMLLTGSTGNQLSA